jgi:cell division protein FtsQ
VPPAWRRRVAVVLAALVVLGALYWLWFRDSSFARVHDVQISGVSGPQARAIRSALEDAGLAQTTLHVSNADLRAAVADYPVVRSITAQGVFPHKLRVEVQLNMPVAILQTPSGRKPVAADGLLLPAVPVSSGLPVLRTQAALPGERVTSGAAFELVRVVGLAPDPLRARLESVGFEAGTGIVAKLTAGPDLIFGDASRMPAKWMAAARVLSAAGARGAAYIDLRLPERPAAGGLATTTVIPLAPAGDPVTSQTPVAPSGVQTPPAGTPARPPVRPPRRRPRRRLPRPPRRRSRRPHKGEPHRPPRTLKLRCRVRPNPRPVVETGACTKPCRALTQLIKSAYSGRKSGSQQGDKPLSVA